MSAPLVGEAVVVEAVPALQFRKRIEMARRRQERVVLHCRSSSSRQARIVCVFLLGSDVMKKTNTNERTWKTPPCHQLDTPTMSQIVEQYTWGIFSSKY
jgi:hypothetical protein